MLILLHYYLNCHPISQLEDDSFSAPPPSLSSSSSLLIPSTGLSSSASISSVVLPTFIPSLISYDGQAFSFSSSSFAPSSMDLIPRRNASDIATMPEFAASRKRKKLTEEDILDEGGISILIPEWFQKQNSFLLQLLH
jgi:hypothetical protein